MSVSDVCRQHGLSCVLACLSACLRGGCQAAEMVTLVVMGVLAAKLMRAVGYLMALRTA